MVYANMQHIVNNENFFLNSTWYPIIADSEFILNINTGFTLHAGYNTFLSPGMYTTCTEAEIEVVELGFWPIYGYFFYMYIIKAYANGRWFFFNERTFKDLSNILLVLANTSHDQGEFDKTHVFIIKYLEKNLWFII